jgi:hypothetical protein
LSHSRDVEFYVLYTRAVEKLKDCWSFAQEVTICIMAHENIRRFASVGDDYGAVLGSPLGAAYVLIEFPARNLHNCDDPTILHFYDTEAKVFYKGIKIPIVVQQVKAAFDTSSSDHGIDGLSDRHPKAAQRAEILCRLNCDLLAA